MYVDSFYTLFFFILLNLLIFRYHKNISQIYNVFDLPNEKRKIHKQIVPLTGGLILIVNILILYPVFKPDNLFVAPLFFLIIFFIGYLDDKFNISASLKLLIIFTFVIVHALLDQNILINNLRFNYFETFYLDGIFQYLFLAFCIASFVNALNMFDGANLQVSIYSIFIFIVLYLNTLNVFYFYLTIPLIFFSVLNYKNLSFLGDSGSILIGYLISYEIIKNYNQSNIFTCEDIFLLMFLPGIDMARLFIYRILKNKNPLKADNLHIHHLLLNKLTFKISLIIVILLAIMPYTLSFFFGRLISITISSFMYLCIIIKYSKLMKE